MAENKKQRTEAPISLEGEMQGRPDPELQGSDSSDTSIFFVYGS